MSNIIIKIQDSNGELLWEFDAEKDKTIHQMAESHDIWLPLACGAGACFVCAVKILSGKECLQQDLTSPPLVELEEDQFLTCIGGIKAKCFDDEEDYEIILQKSY